MALTRFERDQLEDRALLAFGGTLRSDLEHGFRVIGDKGQIAAVYWSDNAAGNEVEMALCDNRLTDRYDLRTVQLWLDLAKERSGRPCNQHKRGGSWPIIGFNYSEALEFLKKCKLLRDGWLPEQDIQDARKRAEGESPMMVEASKAREQLSGLRPTRRNAVIDLLYQAGVDVQGWYKRKDGSPVATPRSNPAYCYNWAFEDPGKSVVACVWHESLRIVDGRIQFDGNMRRLAERLDSIAAASGESADTKIRAREQAERARQLDTLLRGAKARLVPVRVIVNEGQVQSEESLGKQSSVVKVRALDPMKWVVDTYDDITGEFSMHREMHRPQNRLDTEPPLTSHDGRSDATPAAKASFADQHSIGTDGSNGKQIVVTEAYLRSRAVRDAALSRAEGVCEFCNEPGFLTPDARVYLETHHVVPLSERGPDEVWNVAAICPNDHREAHYGERAKAIREELLIMLESHYPDQGKDLRVMADDAR